MNPFAFLKKTTENSENNLKNQPEELDENDTDSVVGMATKVKIIAAMLVVAVATYVALWVQEPTDLKLDVISGTKISDEVATDQASVITDTSRVAAADDPAYPVLAEVSIMDFTFTPANMTIKKGTTVVWTNMDPVDHTITADTFSSSTLEINDSYSYTFDKAGEYLYSCAFHPQMTGKIIVINDSDESDEAVLAETPGFEDELPRDLEDLYPSLAVADDPAPISADLLSVNDEPVETDEMDDLDKEVHSNTPLMVTFDAEELLNSGAVKHETSTAIQESDNLAKSGPEDMLYVFAFITILYINKRKIANIFS